MFDKIPDYGDIMTVEEFEECVESGAFIDYDGHGYFCNPETNVRDCSWKVFPSTIGTLAYKTQRSQWSHVIWFNR